MNERVDAAIQESGGLHNLGWYLNWNAGASEATLDGSFSVEELYAIADHMECYMAAQQ